MRRIDGRTGSRTRCRLAHEATRNRTWEQVLDRVREAPVSLSVVYLPEAEDDIDAAYQQYESQRVGLGEQFLEALRETVDRIRDHPQLYALLHKDIRRTAAAFSLCRLLP